MSFLYNQTYNTSVNDAYYQYYVSGCCAAVESLETDNLFIHARFSDSGSDEYKRVSGIFFEGGIPKNAVISSAKIVFTLSTGYKLQSVDQWRILGKTTNGFTAWITQNDILVSAKNPQWSTGSDYTSAEYLSPTTGDIFLANEEFEADVTSVVQEMVNLSHWSATSKIPFILEPAIASAAFDDVGPSFYAGFYDETFATSLAPKLVIEYSVVDDSWTESDNQYLFKVYSETSSYDPYNGLSVLPPEQEVANINTFDADNLQLYNCEVVDDGLGGQNITIKMPDKLLSIIIDKSGSMSWNDSSNLRYTIAERLIRRIESTYPGNVNYSISSFGGKEVSLVIAASLLENNPFRSEFNRNDIFDKDTFFDEFSDFYGIRILKREDSYPTSPIDGEIIFDGVAKSFFDSNVQYNNNYYYAIYTFNENYNFSDPIFITLDVKNFDAPKGAKIFSNKILKGSGLRLDDNVVYSWHLSEGNNNLSYDFAANSNLSFSAIGANSEIIWLNNEDVPVGSSGLFFPNNTNANNTHYCMTSTDEAYISESDQISFIGFINSFENSTIKRTIFSIEDNSGNELILYVENGNLIIEGSSLLSSSGGIITNVWHCVGFSYNRSSGDIILYIDGIAVISGNISDNLSVGPYSIKIGDSTSYSSWHGYITEISIHNIVRDSTYFNQNSSYIYSEDTDNGDRLSILDFEIASHADYIGGNIYIVKNTDHIPYNENDGTIIYFDSASVGEYVVLDNEYITPNSKVYYRIFSENSNGVVSNIKDSSYLEVDIDGLSDEALSTVPSNIIDGPDNVSITAGNSVNYIRWDNPNSFNRVVIYYSLDDFPIIENNKFEGEKLFDSIDADEFVHRDLINDVTYYYSVFNVDKYGRVSYVSNIKAKPKNSLSNLTIPLLKLEGVSYDINDESVKLDFSSSLKDRKVRAYMSDTICFYFKLLDETGGILDTDLLTSVDVDLSYNMIDNASPNLLNGETEIAQINDKAIKNIIIENVKSGISKGILSLNLQSFQDVYLLNNISDITFDLKINIFDSKNSFYYTSRSLNIYLENPLKITPFNKDNKFVTATCPNTVSSVQESVIKEVEYNGAYLGSTTPFIYRFFVSYKDRLIINPPNMKYRLYELDSDFCEDDINYDNLVLSSTTEVFNENQEILIDGKSSGSYANQSFFDVVIEVPETEKKYLLWTDIRYLGFRYQTYNIVSFVSPLKLDLSVNVPISDGISQSEQFANVYLVDPDNPDNLSLYSVPDDNTLVKWELIPNDNSFISRSIYSLDTGVPSDGVYSKLSDGMADNVFIGPISNVSIPGYDSEGNAVFENHTLKATVIYNGYVSESSQSIEILPIVNTGQEQSASNILVEFDGLKNIIYNNGRDYQKAIITHDPTSSITKYSDCFRSCLSDLEKSVIPLESGQVVYVNSFSDNIEIIWGDVVEYVDPYTGENLLDISSANISTGSANIGLSNGDETYVYFRILEDQLDQNTIGYQDYSNDCECINDSGVLDYSTEYAISFSTVMVSNGELVNLVGGGDMKNGLPPTILVPKNPLEINVVDKRVNSSSVDNLIIDGSSENEFVLEVSYAGLPVIDGTPVTVGKIDISGDNVALKSYSTSTLSYVDPDIDPDNEKSYASLFLRPLSSNANFDSLLNISVEYNVFGVSESKNLYLRVKNNSQSNINLFLNKNSSLILGSSDSYNADMITSRAFGCSEIVSGKLYAIGGINSSKILNNVEEYNIGLDSWSSKASMPSSRFGMSSILDGIDIYVIGGLEYDNSNNRLIVSNKVEKYDTTTNTWQSLSDMPNIGNYVDKDNYGVAFGGCSKLNNKIYVFSGIRNISDDKKSILHNDRVLIYDIASDQWSYSDPILDNELFSYKRMSPSILDNGSDTVYVFNGVRQDSDLSIKYLNTAFSYNINTEVFSNIEDDFDLYINPTYYNTTVNDSVKVIVGGLNKESYIDNSYVSLDISSGFSYDNSNELDIGRAGAFASYDSSGSKLYIVGGLSSTKNNDFLIINTSVYPEELYLNGKQNAEVKIELLDNQGNRPVGDIELLVNAYLQLDSVDDVLIGNIKNNLLSNIVTLSEYNVTSTNGLAYIYIDPRSDDIIDNLIESFNFNENINNIRYRIVLDVKVVDSTWKGENDIEFVDSIYHGTINEDNYLDSRTNLLVDNSGSALQLIPSPLYQNSPSYIRALAVTAWMPYVEQETDGFVGAGIALDALDQMGMTVNNGFSPFFDSVVEQSYLLSEDNYDNMNKNIIVFSDYQDSSVEYRLEDAITNFYNIDSSMVFGLSYASMNVGESDLNYISPNKIGEVHEFLDNVYSDVINVSNSSYVDDYIGDIIGKTDYSIGNGKITYIVDLNEKSSIDNIQPNFILYDNTNADWKVSFSEDGYNFDNESCVVVGNNDFSFSNILARYLKFDINLYSSLSVSNEEAYEDVATAGKPYLDNIDILITRPKCDYIYFNQESISGEANQIVAVSEHSDFNDQKTFVYLGVSSSVSNDWKDYSNENVPGVIDAGKIVVPVRYDTIYNEVVEISPFTDGYSYYLPYGPFNKDSSLTIYDSNDNIISNSKYKIFNDEGLIVFNERQTSYIRVRIVNQNKINLGIKIENYDYTQTVYIKNAGIMYKNN